MSSFTIRIGALLVILGVVSYVMTGAASLTALIPSVAGAVFVACGLAARRRSSAIPLVVAAVFAGVGVFGTATAIGSVARGLAEGVAIRPSAVSRASMALVLLVYLVVAARALATGAIASGRR